MKSRLGVLDGLRASSILLVLASHFLPLGPRSFRLNETAGAMGMCLFFALSGFLITTSLIEGQSVRSFFIRRFARIIPLALAFLAVVFLIVSFDPARLLGSVIFVENYQHQYLNGLNAHFWSLCVEVHFYIGIGLAVLLLGRKGIWIVVPACLFVTLLRISDGATINIKTHLRVDEILAGASVAMLVHIARSQPKTTGLIFFGSCLFWIASSSPFAGPLQYLRPYSSALLLWVALHLNDGTTMSTLESRAARYIATISYALYVIHPLTLHGVMNEGSALVKYGIKRPVSLAITFLAAHLSTFHYEAKWIALAKSNLRKSKSASVSVR